MVAAMSEWISCEKSLPKPGDIVLIYADGNIDTGYLCQGKHNGPFDEFTLERSAPIDEGIYFDLEQVSHWMPLPEPPK
jgi:hypothetical protein